MGLSRTYKLLGLVAGRARGEVLALPRPLSIYGELDRETGRIRGDGDASGKILVFTRHRGSTVAPYVLYGLFAKGRAPKAIIVSSKTPDPILVAACVMAGIPLAAGIPAAEVASLSGHRCTGELVVEKPRAEALFRTECD